MTLTEYVGRINGIVEHARQQYEVLVAGEQGAVLVAEGAQLTDFTPHDLQVALERVREIEVEEAVGAIDPPEQVADFHRLLFDFDGTFVSAQDALAARAGITADWEALSNSSEMAAYRVALAEDKRKCFNSQAELNAIAERREVFAETPWIPGELKELFEVVLSCQGTPSIPRTCTAQHHPPLDRPPATSMN